MTFFVGGRQEVKRLLDGWDWKFSALTAIHEYGRFRFTAADGRYFSTALDGESIGHLMNASDAPDFRTVPRVWRELKGMAGAIVMCDNNEPNTEDNILFYHDRQELIDAWRELHRISGVAMSDADAERLAEHDEEEHDTE